VNRRNSDQKVGRGCKHGMMFNACLIIQRSEMRQFDRRESVINCCW